MKRRIPCWHRARTLCSPKLTARMSSRSCGTKRLQRQKTTSWHLLCLSCSCRPPPRICPLKSGCVRGLRGPSLLHQWGASQHRGTSSTISRSGGISRSPKPLQGEDPEGMTHSTGECVGSSASPSFFAQKVSDKPSSLMSLGSKEPNAKGLLLLAAFAFGCFEIIKITLRASASNSWNRARESPWGRPGEQKNPLQA